MKASSLYQKLEKEFIKPCLTDDWQASIPLISEFISPNFKKRYMGIVCDFAKEITKAYTAVFPSNHVMQSLLDKQEEGIMLFVHHPATWDIRTAPKVFLPMDLGLLRSFRERKMSIYNLHVPLDNYGKYSTGVALAKALGLTPKKPFAPYYGSLSGLFCNTDIRTVNEFKTRFQNTMGHKVSLYPYGGNNINSKMVAVIPGGGNSQEFLEEIANEEVNTLVTGIAVKNSHSQQAHQFAEKNNINILGGTHYSTEKFACIGLCSYFKKLGLPSEFIEDKPVMEDL